MPKTIHVPMRTCIVTREKKPKNELIRFVLDSEKNISLDKDGKLKGRGANMTPSLEVFDNGLKSNALNRALKMNVREEDLKRLREELEQYIEDNREKKVFKLEDREIE